MELLDARYDFYDKSKTGTLEEDELKTLLTDLNEGIPPSKAEVREDKKNSPR
jgi:Ca2+-binding EF-hand superfamily protein